MPTVLIVQPYLPEYRVRLFDALVDKLSEQGVECRIAAGEPVGAQALRGDRAGSRPWSIPLKTRSISFRGHWLRTYSSWRHWRGADAVILELASGAIDTSLALMMPRHRRIGVWGHVDSYVAASGRVDRMIENWQLQRADQVFAYTEGGRATAVRRGVKSERTTAVMNTVDTTNLVSSAAALTDAEVADFSRENKLAGAEVFAYIGGLDHSKRIGFLSAVLDLLWEARPQIRLIVGGVGADVNLLRRAEARGQAVLLGRVGDRGKALMSRTALGLMMPGRVGLVAVESYALGLPIITTDWPYHAPEFEYLSPGIDCVVTIDDPAAYARGIVELAADTDLLAELSRAARNQIGRHSIDDAAARFADGVMTLLRA